MEKQNFSNHKKYYFPHHFVFYPVLLILMAGCAYCIFTYKNNKEWIAIFIILVLIGWLSVMLRQHYALTLQNRTVRLEMRLRYYQLTQRRLEFIEYQLTFNQLAALRFASDDQLPYLLNEAISEKLSANDIKKRIKNWHPDNMRV